MRLGNGPVGCLLNSPLQLPPPGGGQCARGSEDCRSGAGSGKGGSSVLQRGSGIRRAQFGKNGLSRHLASAFSMHRALALVASPPAARCSCRLAQRAGQGRQRWRRAAGGAPSAGRGLSSCAAKRLKPSTRRAVVRGGAACTCKQSGNVMYVSRRHAAHTSSAAAAASTRQHRASVAGAGCPAGKLDN